jgi:hypothetical protein
VVSGNATATKFYLVTPCRILDTRNANGTYGGPALAANSSRNVPVAGVCGIPAGATALSINMAVLASASDGYMTVYPGPAGSPIGPTSTINYRANKMLANNAIIRTGSDSINVYNSGPSAAHFLIDVNGYFK